MTNIPFLSIIIPVYKVEPYLRECLDSISVSESDCWEAIVVDDGSPDGCPQICDEYAARDGRFRVIHQKNAGVAAARNAGLDAARGTWAWFVDSDDVVDMSHIGEMVTWLKEHEDTDLVMFDLETFQDGDSPTLISRPFKIGDEQLDKNDFLMKHVCYHHQRLWYHRRGWWYDHHQRRAAHHTTIRFSRGIRVAEDLEFQYKYLMLCQHPAKFDVSLYHYRLRDESATQDATYRVKVVEDLPVVLYGLAQWIRERQVQLEPWLDFRIMKMIQNLLYSASQVKGLNMADFQKTVRCIVSEFQTMGFPFVHNSKIRLANKSISLYFLFNKIYLRLKGIE